MSMDAISIGDISRPGLTPDDPRARAEHLAEGEKVLVAGIQGELDSLTQNVIPPGPVSRAEKLFRCHTVQPRAGRRAATTSHQQMRIVAFV
jgi:hypothetical protein